MNQKGVTTKELYQLRKFRLEAERQALLAQLKQNWLQTFLLGLERKYGLVGTRNGLDVLTGQISSQEGISESVGDENATAQRPA